MPKDYSKSKKAIIIGWNLKKMKFFNNLDPKILKTSYGKINYYQLKNSIFISRHGNKENIPPHRINYRANIAGLKKLGVKCIFSFNSVGSLKKNIKPGTLLIASDYIDFNPLTFYEKKARFVTPELSLNLRERLIRILRKLRISFKNNGVYFQTKGPRLETKAEIKMMSNFADIVGMTMAKEATLARELDMEYVSLCSIDNYAHGIIKKPLSIKDIRDGQIKIKKKFERIIKEIIRNN